MSEYTKEFDDWWYKPLLESAKWSGGVPDKDMMRYKDLGKQSAFHAWTARDQEITRIKKALEIAKETINVSANQLEGIALAFTAHGTNLNVKFMIENCYENARQAREAQKQIKEVMEG